ncbi:hypothetical protein [Rhodococcus globerulus]|uniref:Uncharacterized protein n=1 Tax=Rhodococcus globerulus TaxID=33008 RepID=A0ABU4C5B0_RHOGO|nr:hypothetical protein [Rhodococcus globerulus]MDV6271694.1 hypothetical protein [Rhodococcus globerulus]
MITVEVSVFLVPVPRPLLLRFARFFDTVAACGGANLPDGLEQLSRGDFAGILSPDADGIRAIANAEAVMFRRCGAHPIGVSRSPEMQT